MNLLNFTLPNLHIFINNLKLKTVHIKKIRKQISIYRPKNH